MTPGQEKIRLWKQDHVQAVRELFGIEPDLWQADALRACGGPRKERRRLGMKACTGPGKSTLLAWEGWIRLLCYADPGEHPKGAALSGEGRDNLRDNLWAELAKWQARSPLLKAAFTWNHDRIYAKDHPETWFLAARSYAKDADAEAIGRALSGLHSRYPFALLDESGDMPLQVGQKAEQIFTGGCRDGLIATAGNPTSTTGLLYHVATQARDKWIVITITADPDDPKRTPRVDIELAREQITQYGRENPWVMATILGEFPNSGFDTLLSLHEVEAAMGRTLREDQYNFSQKRLGIDAARFGNDPWVIFPRQGLAGFKPVVMRGPRSGDVAARVIQAKIRWGSEVEFFDGTGGYASGAVDSMIQGGYSPIEIHFSGEPINPRYFNKRSEIWFLMAEWVKRGGALPNDPILAKELTAPKFSFQNGKFRLEEKDQIKKRLGFSPNHGDALALMFSHPDMPAAGSIEALRLEAMGKTKAEWDPFDSSRS